MINIGKAFEYGWQKTKENLEFALTTTFFTIVIATFIDKIEKICPTNTDTICEKSVLAILVELILAIVLILVRIGYNKTFLKIYDEFKPKFFDLFKEYDNFWKYIGISIIFPVVIFVGFIFLIIPGIFFAVRFSFSTLMVIDMKIGPIKAMQESYAITKGSFFKIMWFWVVIFLFNFLGLMLFGIGLLFTIPISTFASIYIYRTLLKANAGVIQTSSPQTA